MVRNPFPAMAVLCARASGCCLVQTLRLHAPSRARAHPIKIAAFRRVFRQAWVCMGARAYALAGGVGRGLCAHDNELCRLSKMGPLPASASASADSLTGSDSDSDLDSDTTSESAGPAPGRT